MLLFCSKRCEQSQNKQIIIFLFDRKPLKNIKIVSKNNNTKQVKSINKNNNFL